MRNLWGSLVHPTLHGTPPADLRAEAVMITRLSAAFALTADLAMGLLGGKLKRLELLSARLGDVLSALYLASGALWRYEVEADPKMLPFARAAIRVQLARGADTLHELYANLPSGLLRLVAPLLLRGTRQRRPLTDKTVLALADTLRTDPALLARLCPDIGQPRSGGLRDLMDALALSMPVADELATLNGTLRRTRSLEQAAAGSRDPAAALAYLKAADRVIQVDDFAP
jgi:acyl-CoA dehydrogenase